MNEVLAALASSIEELLRFATFPRAEDDLVSVAVAVSEQASRLDAVRALLSDQLESAGWAKREGCTSTRVWLRQRCHVTIGAAHRSVVLGGYLNAREALLTAVHEGRVTTDQALVIGDALDALPRSIGAELRDNAEQALIDTAPTLTPAELAKVGARILDLLAPEVAEAAEAARLARSEEEGYRRRELRISLDDAGCGRLSGRLDPEATATVRAAIESLARPFPKADGVRDPRSAGQRNADALHDLCRLALDSGRLPDHGGTKPQLIITTTYDALASALAMHQLTDGELGQDAGPAAQTSPNAGRFGNEPPRPDRRALLRDSGSPYAAPHNNGSFAAGLIGAGTLDNGVRISPETVRRLACDALIIPAVLGAEGELLDLGRTQRIINTQLRNALIARDLGCTFPGCDRPPRWTQAHHIIPWSEGGATSLENSTLLCGFHHRLIHSGDWRIMKHGNGKLAYLPPRHIDPHQQPRFNTLHLRR